MYLVIIMHGTKFSKYERDEVVEGVVRYYLKGKNRPLMKYRIESAQRLSGCCWWSLGFTAQGLEIIQIVKPKKNSVLEALGQVVAQYKVNRFICGLAEKHEQHKRTACGNQSDHNANDCWKIWVAKSIYQTEQFDDGFLLEQMLIKQRILTVTNAKKLLIS